MEYLWHAPRAVADVDLNRHGGEPEASAKRRPAASQLYGTVTLTATKFFINGVTATVKAPYDGKVKEKRKGMGAS